MQPPIPPSPVARSRPFQSAGSQASMRIELPGVSVTLTTTRQRSLVAVPVVLYDAQRLGPYPVWKTVSLDSDSTDTIVVLRNSNVSGTLRAAHCDDTAAAIVTDASWLANTHEATADCHWLVRIVWCLLDDW